MEKRRRLLFIIPQPEEPPKIWPPMEETPDEMIENLEKAVASYSNNPRDLVFLSVLASTA